MALNVIADGILNYFDTWFVGDRFLRDTYNSFQMTINEASANKKLVQPYLYEFYNLYQSNRADAQERAPSRILNALTDLINLKQRLPRFLVIVIDSDIISDVDIFKRDVIKSIKQMTTWLVKQINIQIRCKRIELMAHSPGTIYGNDPTVIFIQMIRRINVQLRRGSFLEEMYNLRPKFNNTLNEAVSKVDQHILTINSCNTSSHFDHKGRLSTKGKAAFWYEMDDLLERFDKKQIKLLPNPKNNNYPKYF